MAGSDENNPGVIGTTNLHGIIEPRIFFILIIFSVAKNLDILF